MQQKSERTKIFIFIFNFKPKLFLQFEKLHRMQVWRVRNVRRADEEVSGLRRTNSTSLHLQTHQEWLANYRKVRHLISHNCMSFPSKDFSRFSKNKNITPWKWKQKFNNYLWIWIILKYFCIHFKRLLFFISGVPHLDTLINFTI